MTEPQTHILAVVKSYLAEAFAIPAHDVGLDARLQDDLGLDSLDVVEVAAAVMETAGGAGAWEDGIEVERVSDLVSLVAGTRA
jgi:acyl carrier protein